MTYNAWSPELWQGESLKDVKLCYHCGDEILKTKTLCDYCTTKEKREAMHQANAEIFAAAGLEYDCASCAKIRARKELEKLLEAKLVQNADNPS